MKGYEVLEIIKLLREKTSSPEEQLPILTQLTSSDIDHTGMMILNCALADIYYELEDYEKFVQSCEYAKDYAGAFVTNLRILYWYKETLLKQAEYYTSKGEFDNTVSTYKCIISMLQGCEASYSEFFAVQEKFIGLLDQYRDSELVRYKTTWRNMPDEEKRTIVPRYVDEVSREKREEFLFNLNQGLLQA